MVATKPEHASRAHSSAVMRSFIIVIPVAVATVFSSLYLDARHMSDVSQQQQQTAPTRTSHLEQDTTQPTETPLPATSQSPIDPDTDAPPSSTTPAPMPQPAASSPQRMPQAASTKIPAVLQQLTIPVTQTLQSACQPVTELGGGMSNDSGNNAQKCLL